MTEVIKAIKDQLYRIAEGHADEILASEGLSLQVIANRISLQICQDLAPRLHRLVQQTEDLDTLHKNEDFLVLEQVLIKAQDVKSLVSRASEALNQAFKKIREHQPPLVKEEELAEVKRNYLNDFTAPKDLADFVSADRNYEEIIRTFCTNSAVLSGVFHPGEEVDLVQIETKYPRVAWHARKTAFDQICMLVFGYHPQNYDALRKVEIINSAHKLNQLAEHKVKKNEIVFAYVNVQPMATPKFPRFAQLLNPHEGVGVVVEDVEHRHEVLPVHCVIAGVAVVVKVPVWYGVVITARTSENGKPLDFKTLLREAESVGVNKPELTKENNLLEKKNHFINSFGEIFQSLATSQDSDYNNRYQALLAKGK